jgi:hypothetical protein
LRIEQSLIGVCNNKADRRARNASCAAFVLFRVAAGVAVPAA